MDKQALLPWLVIVCPLLVILLWCAVVLLLSVLSGWRALARHYPARPEDLGSVPRYRMRSARFGWTDYTAILQIACLEDAFVIGVLVPFQLGHSPLRFPWSEMTVSRCRGFFRAGFRIQLRRVPGVTIDLWVRSGDPLEAEFVRRFPDLG